MLYFKGIRDPKSRKHSLLPTVIYLFIFVRVANREQLRSQCVLGAFGYAGPVGATQGRGGRAGTLSAGAAQRLHEAGAQPLQPLCRIWRDPGSSTGQAGVSSMRNPGVPQGLAVPPLGFCLRARQHPSRSPGHTLGVTVLRCVLPEARRVRGTGSSPGVGPGRNRVGQSCLCLGHRPSLPEAGRAQDYVGLWRGTSWPTLLPSAYLRVHLFLLAAVRRQKCVPGDRRWLFLEPSLRALLFFPTNPSIGALRQGRWLLDPVATVQLSASLQYFRKR